MPLPLSRRFSASTSDAACMAPPRDCTASGGYLASGLCGLRRLQRVVAYAARRISSRQLSTYAVHLRANALQRIVMLLVRVPGRELPADAIQRPLVAPEERVRSRIQLADHVRGRGLDACRVLGREVDQRADIGRTPLQPRRRTVG